MAAAGAPPGVYTVAHHQLEVGADRVVRLPGSKGFAGSALAPDEGVANLQRWLGLEAAAARALFSTTVADAFGIELPAITNQP
jgi:N-acetylglucosamine-6-phosphate deacetylase